MNAPALDPNRWKALAVVGTAFLMTGLDISIVNVALPTIQRELHFSEASLQWVVTAYAITFAGFLLLGGRAADLLGRRRVFLVGVAIFTVASLLCGLSTSDKMLIVVRGLQGVGGAIISPAALSIVSTAFPEGAERNKALGVWGALGGSGAAIGVILGGVLTRFAGWDWIFFVNVPIGALVILATPAFVRESRVESAQRRFDPLGAVAVTASLILLVYGISRAPDKGWGNAVTIAMLIAAAVLMAAFLVIESRVAEPLMPFRIFRLRTVAAANVVGLVIPALMFSLFFLVTLYMQEVLRYSPLQAGAAMLATAVTSIFAAVGAEALVTRLGPKYVMVGGIVLLGGGLVWFTQITTHGHYLSDIFPGFLLMGIGIGFAFVPVSIVGLTGVAGNDAGLASGLLNTTQQIGGAVGLAVASTISATRVSHELAHGAAPAQALVSGFTLAYWVTAVLAFVGAGAALLILRGVHAAEPVEADEVETHAVSSFCVNRAATGALATVVLGGSEAPETPAVVG